MKSKTKKRIIAFIMALIIIMTVAYVFYGKNWLAEQQYIQRQKNSEFLKNELMQKMLDIEKQSQEVFNEILNLSYDIELFQKQKIKLKKTDERIFEVNLEQKPYFDYKNLYLISSNQIFVLNKDLKKIKWDKHFEEELINIELLDANRILVLTKQKNAICLNRDSGKEIWIKQLKTLPKIKDNSIFQISLNKFKQLDRSIIVMYSDNEIELIENITGTSMVIYHSENKIEYLSDFDILEKCIYFIEKNKISKLIFDVKS
ncbi:MAG: hypothetical protein P9M11_09635 [Candidatus Tenebribacter burtonii]|jgi:hypothetical protein|nr:hypothetical protein [Candidatus Tenebribacter burtonii]